MAEKKNKGGRPTIITPELAEEICIEISKSTLMLEDLCDSKPHWPCANAIYEWRIKHHETFGEMFTEAKRSQIEPLVSNMLRLVRDSTDDFYIDSKGDPKPNTSRSARLKEEIAITKWLAARLCPRLYADKTHTEHGIEGSLLEKVIDKL